MNEYVLKSVVVIISISFLFVNTFRKSFSSKIGITVRVQIDEQQIENFLALRQFIANRLVSLAPVLLLTLETIISFLNYKVILSNSIYL